MFGLIKIIISIIIQIYTKVFSFSLAFGIFFLGIFYSEFFSLQSIEERIEILYNITNYNLYIISNNDLCLKVYEDSIDQLSCLILLSMLNMVILILISLAGLLFIFILKRRISKKK